MSADGRRGRFALLVTAACTLVAAVGAPALVSLGGRTAPSPTEGDGSAQRSGGEAYGRLPVYFERNVGQADDDADFVARTSRYTAFVSSDSALFSLPTSTGEGGRGDETSAGPGHFLSMELLGAAADVAPAAERRLPGVANYLVGSDPAAWRTHVPTFGQVRYRDVYPSVDLVYRGDGDRLKYDVIVRPGGDPDVVRLGFGEGTPVTVDDGGDLLVGARGRQLRHEQPVVYQVVDGRRRTVDARYVVDPGGSVRFGLGEHDPGLALVIDPAVVYATNLGGALGDSATDVEADASGAAVVVGSTSSTNFPTANALDATPNGASDVFVAKLNAAGTALVYSTYLGGTAADAANGVDLDASGNVYVTGSTSSTNFPTANAIQAARAGGSDAFVAKLAANGSGLIYSTYLGGAAEDVGRGIAVDGSGRAHVGGETRSSGFPVTAPTAADATFGGGTCPTATEAARPCRDGFVTVVNAAGSALDYSSFLGGGADDAALAVAADATNSYVTGETRSTDFPTAAALDATFGGGACPATTEPARLCRDAFVTRVDPAGSGASSLVYSTYLGGTTSTFLGEIGDSGAGIGVDTSGNAYVTGETSSDDFPTASPMQGSRAGEADAFVAKLNPSGSALVYSTYLGGRSGDGASALSVDGAGRATIAGSASSGGFPQVQPVGLYAGNGEPYFATLSAAGSAVEFSSYLGGTAGDSASGVAVDAAGAVYVAGSSSSPDVPTVAALQDANAGGNDALLIKVAPTPSGPLVTDLNPRTGPTSGGATLTITGRGLTGATAVQVGGVAATSIAVQSDTQLTVVTPARPAGAHDVRVTTSAGTSPANPIARHHAAEGTWRRSGALGTPRFVHTTTLLNDGRVLVTGGRSSVGGPAIASAELYNPATGTWTPAGALGTARFGHSATVLANGKVLVAGGFTLGSTANAQPVLDTAELFDPATGTFTATGAMVTRRSLHPATRLPDGRVLVAGGRTCASPPPTACDSTSTTSAAEIYDPVTGTWSATGSLNHDRHTTSMVVLRTGKVLVVAGFPSAGSTGITSELYDPAAGTWALSGNLNIARARPSVTILPDGNVLATSGFGGGAPNSAELYDVTAGTWSLAGILTTSRFNAVATLLPNGKVLIMGGGNGGIASELFDPSTRSFTSAGWMTAAHGSSSSNSLGNVAPLLTTNCGTSCGSVLIVGDNDQPWADLYTPPPNVASVTPATGSPAGGQTVTITGTGFSAVSEVRFGDTPVAFTVESPTRITFRAPARAVGPVSVTLRSPGGVATAQFTVVAGPTSDGYWLVASDGGVFAFGGAAFHGSTGAIRLNSPVVGMAKTTSNKGYWLVAADGGVFAFGDAAFYGSTGAIRLNSPVVGMAATPSGKGYWLVAADGGVFAFGDAAFFGSTGAIRLNRPVVGMAATPSGKGYFLVAADGGVFAFGDAVFRGSTGAIRLNSPMVGLTATPSGNGYLLVAADGGVFAFGDAQFRGSTGAIRLNSPVVGIDVMPAGNGYWLVAADGGVFAFGDAGFFGSTGAIRLNRPVVGMAAREV